MALSKAKMRERKQEDRANTCHYRVKTGVCTACHRLSHTHQHYPDYSKPEYTIQVCASCHKKIHLYLSGKQRTDSNPYINPLVKLGLTNAI